jgi:imidazolonepropionase-like amidohydrolase
MTARTILRNANVLTGDKHLGKATVVIEGNRIVSVGDAPAKAKPGDRDVDLAGKTVMPGLITSHYHASYWNIGGSPLPFGLEVPPALHVAHAIHNLGVTLDCGFTSAISAGAPYAIDASMKLAMDEGIVRGPRLVACGNDLSSTGHSNDMTHPWFYELGNPGSIRRCDSPGEYRKGVRAEVKAGSEMIKLFVTGGHGVASPKERMEMSKKELKAAIDTARERGVGTRGHIANRDTILLALKLGMDIIDHGDGFDEECIEAMVGTSQSLVPSIFFPQQVLENWDISTKAAMQADFDEMAAIIPRANAAGVRILLGDDYGAIGVPHGRYAEELALYVAIGIPALDVIRWGTKYGAEAMNRGGELGTLEAGKLADLLVVDGDPLKDIALCATPDRLLAIVKDGVFMKDRLDEGAGSARSERQLEMAK